METSRGQAENDAGSSEQTDLNQLNQRTGAISSLSPTRVPER
jgi:hypothetical protein